MSLTINALDPSQRHVLDSLLSEDAPDLSLVYGPPGTGKSHLIVSLLFELAKQGKKVLFVSQNREALDVIIRKYHDIDNDMHLGGADLKFLDLCLYLSDPSQRSLKYIKGLNTRIKAGLYHIPYTPSKSNDDAEPPYTLTYRELDKNNNDPTIYNSEHDEKKLKIGLDELLVNNLEFVRRNDLMAAYINELDRVNVRSIYKNLRDYKSHSEDFKRFNAPNDELRFLNKNNQTLSITQVRDATNDILQESEDCKQLYEIKNRYDNPIDIETLLSSVIMCGWVMEYFDIDEIRKDSVDYSTLYDSFKKAISEYTGLNNVKTIALEHSERDVIAFGKNDAAIRDVDSLEEAIAYSKIAKGFIKDLEVFEPLNLSDDISLKDVIDGILNEMDFSFVNDFAVLKNYQAEHLRSACRQVEDWSKMGIIGKKFHIFEYNILNNNRELCELIEANQSYLKNIAHIIDGTDMTLGAFRYKCIEAKRGGVSLEFGEKISNAKLIEFFKHALATKKKINDYFGDDTYYKKMSIEKEKELFSSQISLVDKLAKIARKNSIESLSPIEIAELINDNIENISINETIQGIEQSCAKYTYKKPGESFVKYCERVLADKRINAKTINTIMGVIADNHFTDIGNAQQLKTAIAQSREKEVFSTDFYLLRKDETIGKWLERSQLLYNYSNYDDFNNYINHNIFISKIKNAFGAKNEKFINKYLSMDLDFDDFAEYIVYSIKKSLYDALPKYQQAAIDDKHFFKLYKNQLSKDRKSYYESSIRSMAIRYENPASELAKNLYSNGTIMERIRRNTQLILDAYPVVIATPAEVAKYLAAEKEIFDFVIFDEASQLLPGQALPSIYRAKRAVIVGDPHQMPPVSSIAIGASFADNYDDDELGEDETSILDIVKNMQIDDIYHLKVHYRSKYNVLFEPSRRAIYSEDDIRPIVEAKSTEMPLYIADDLGEDPDDGFRMVLQRANHYISRNPDTSFCILFTRKDKMGEMGFKKYLESHTDEARAILEKYDNEKLLISTITNCQGIMGDHTILYIPYYKSPSSMWFFKDTAGAYRRLNVAITRQVETLDLIMGDSRGKWLNVCQQLAQSPSVGPNTKKSAELLGALLTNAGQQIDEDYLERTLGANADDIDSPLTQELYDKLCSYFGDRIGNELKIWCEVGYKILIPNNDALLRNSYNVGYRIDIGIYSVRRKRFVLGIEMDGATYHSGFYKEFSDSQRQEILESKGWNIYRIWSTNWLRNTEFEFNNLIRTIEEELAVEDEPEPDPVPIIEVPTTVIVDGSKEDEEEESSEDDAADGGDDSGNAPASPERIEVIKPNNAYGVVSYRTELIKYLSKSLTLGRPVEIKYINIHDDDLDISLLPYQKMILKNVADDYIEAKFDAASSFYRIYIDNIVAYIFDNSDDVMENSVETAPEPVEEKKWYIGENGEIKMNKYAIEEFKKNGVDINGDINQGSFLYGTILEALTGHPELFTKVDKVDTSSFEA